MSWPSRRHGANSSFKSTLGLGRWRAHRLKDYRSAMGVPQMTVAWALAFSMATAAPVTFKAPDVSDGR